ncbi:hypothetical protein EYC84_005599 [Monilinia fructicola]|uniref:Uncharacterized protein n=1 Tax=Monilinia fructicola TaxID=38448 RepID=A0A5M9K5J0_MONFR|nr:hypothetical protein EYC84_005599 [Monilinia fructicola]
MPRRPAWMDCTKFRAALCRINKPTSCISDTAKNARKFETPIQCDRFQNLIQIKYQRPALAKTQVVKAPNPKLK